MKRYVLTAIVIIFPVYALIPWSSTAEEAFQSAEIVLYNQMNEFEARSPSAEVLASFIKKLTAKAAPLLNNPKVKGGKSGIIAVAIRPDGTMKLWVDVEDVFQPDITASLEMGMKDIGVPKVRNGPIAFAVHFNLLGGSSKPKGKTDQIQLPQSWTKAAEGQGKSLAIPDEILPLVWKDAHPEQNKSSFFVPEGYDLQDLKPTGGKILRPKGWFYTEGHREHAFMWTVSKEDPKKGPYNTGVRIQCFVGVQKITGKSPKEFVRSFVDGKKETAEIISQRPEQTQDLFTRIGIETREKLVEGKEKKAYRILYSCFWGNEADIVVIVISGTTPDLWMKYADTFDAMSGFELIDMKRFGEDRTKTSSIHGKPTVYNSIKGKATPLDDAIHKAFETRFTVVDLIDPEDYVSPKPITGSLPSSPKTSTGELLKGYVLLAYIVSIEGRATEPTILKSTDQRLNQIAVKALKEWRLEPAKLKGTSISTVAAQEFNFNGK